MTDRRLVLKANLSETTRAKIGLSRPEDRGDLKSAAQGRGLTIRETAAMLCEAYPQTFDFKNRKPLKIGILDDLYDALKQTYSKSRLRKGLGYYTQNYRYQKALMTQDRRYDLAGRVCGEVAQEEKTLAQGRFGELKKKISASAKNPSSIRRPQAGPRHIFEAYNREA